MLKAISHSFDLGDGRTITLETYKNKPIWKKIVKKAMEQDFSWDKSAKKYLDLYRRAITLKTSACVD